MVEKETGGKPCILVVDDYNAILKYLKIILEIEGYTVFTATDGVEALKLMEKEACFDLIVSDIEMPQMDGYTLLETVRARLEWTSIPFIFVTASSETVDALKARNLGANDYITKPVTRSELVMAVGAQLEHVQAA